MRPPPRDHRVAADPNSALSSEGPIQGACIKQGQNFEWAKCNRPSQRDQWLGPARPEATPLNSNRFG